MMVHFLNHDHWVYVHLVEHKQREHVMLSTVIHFGPPADADDYFQESGRAGRDGIESNVVLYYYPAFLIGHVSRNMKDYWKSTDRCHSVQLLQHFVGGIDTTTVSNVSHNCCDVCTRECTCRVPCPFLAQHSQLPGKSEECK